MNTRDRIEELEEMINELQDKLDRFDPSYESEDQLCQMYDDMLNECNPIEGIPDYWDVRYSELLQSNDPVMYRCGLSDFMDSVDNESFDEYREMQEELEELQNELEELKDQLEEEDQE